MASALRIGLTGGIGSGKSTAAGFLHQRGAALIDTDAISRALTAPGGDAIASLRDAFGSAAIAADGGLDRDWMRARAFADPTVRQQLEAILHPMIGERTRTLADQAAAAPCIVFDIPLLVESGRWRTRVDRVLVIDCPARLQIERVMRRSQWTREAVESVIAQQVTRAQRRAAADAVIDNGEATPATRLDDAIALLWRHWIAAR